MNILYSIKAKGTRIHTSDPGLCDRMCAALLSNGFTPRVKIKLMRL